MRPWIAVSLLIVICLGVYWPHKNAEFVLDDYYTVVRNPLIKNPALYKNIWISRLFDAHQSSGYIKFGYYRPVLQSSWIVDYRLFHLKASGFQWVNLLIHLLNCFLIYILICQLFRQEPLALKASVLFCVLPTQEWVVRYITGRGDELSALFALVSLVSFLWVFKAGSKKGYIFVLLFWILSALTREVAISYILYAILLVSLRGAEGEVAISVRTSKDINHFSFYWFLIGILPIIVIFSIIPKLGNILALHILYFASIGLCLWMAQLPLRWVVGLVILFAAISFYQGQFWTTEEVLLRHTRSLEWWPASVADQQLLMKYDEDIPAIKNMVSQASDPLIKAMWLRRLGVICFKHGDLSGAQQYFDQALSLNPSDVDTLDAAAVVYHDQGQEAESLKVLRRALEINPSYSDTLRTLGIHYFNQKDFSQARVFLSRCLILDPDNPQARRLLNLANTMN